MRSFNFCADILNSQFVASKPNALSVSAISQQIHKTLPRPTTKAPLEHKNRFASQLKYLLWPTIRTENTNESCRSLLIIPSGTTSSSAMTKRMSIPTSTESLGFAWSIDQEWNEKNTKTKIRNASIVRYVKGLFSMTPVSMGNCWTAFANAECISSQFTTRPLILIHDVPFYFILTSLRSQ